MNILFVCTGNTCRSPMAEAIAADIIRKDPALRQRVLVGSAGLAAMEGADMSANAKTALEMAGIPFRTHYAKRLDASLTEAADRIICMSDSHKQVVRAMFPQAAEKTLTLAEFAGKQGSVEDPYGLGEKEYFDCCKQIGQYLQEGFARFSF